MGTAESGEWLSWRSGWDCGRESLKLGALERSCQTEAGRQTVGRHGSAEVVEGRIAEITKCFLEIKT